MITKNFTSSPVPYKEVSKTMPQRFSQSFATIKCQLAHKVDPGIFFCSRPHNPRSPSLSNHPTIAPEDPESNITTHPSTTPRLLGETHQHFEQTIIHPECAQFVQIHLKTLGPFRQQQPSACPYHSSLRSHNLRAI